MRVERLGNLARLIRSYLPQASIGTYARVNTQLIFCDLSTPKQMGKTKEGIEEEQKEAAIFDDVYHEIERKLTGKGVPPEEIAFIHSANTEIRKAELFANASSSFGITGGILTALGK